MSLPISKSQIDRLGQRLIACESAADEDLALLEDVLIAYAGVVFQARQILDVLENDGFRDVSITGRAKTTQTTLEKLVRNKSRLSSIEDLAGVRIVADITLSEWRSKFALDARMRGPTSRKRPLTHLAEESGMGSWHFRLRTRNWIP